MTALTNVFPSLARGGEADEGGGGGMICTVIEAGKGGPYWLLWQELPSC
jgi:hypothetical protein